MANLSEDIQCAGSDTRPPMLDRTDFASWQQRIRLYCQGTEGALHLGPKRPRVYFDLSPEDKERYNADIQATNILLQGLPKDIYSLINHYTNAKDIWDNVKMLLEGETIHDYYVWFSKLINDMRNIKITMSRMQLNSMFVNNMLPEWGRFVTAVKLNRGAAGYGGVQNKVGNANPGQARQNSEYFKDKMLLMQAQENGVALDEEQLLFITGGQDNVIDEDVDEQPVQDLALNVDNVFQANDCDAFDFDVDEAHTAQTMFMANLSSADPVYDKAGHEMHDDVQPNYVVDSRANYTSDGNMIPYDQYIKDNAVPVVQSNVSSVSNDAYMMIFNDMHEP
ncbi:hypothetical protein Tco_0879822, partial [Tanacetum coccineum]